MHPPPWNGVWGEDIMRHFEMWLMRVFLKYWHLTLNFIAKLRCTLNWMVSARIRSKNFPGNGRGENKTKEIVFCFKNCSDLLREKKMCKSLFITMCVQPFTGLWNRGPLQSFRINLVLIIYPLDPLFHKPVTGPVHIGHAIW